jgi:hypothetical protein
MSRLLQDAQIIAGIVVHRDRQVDLALKILLDRLDRCDLARKRQIEDISAATRPAHNAIARALLGPWNEPCLVA